MVIAADPVVVAVAAVAVAVGVVVAVAVAAVVVVAVLVAARDFLLSSLLSMWLLLSYDALLLPLLIDTLATNFIAMAAVVLLLLLLLSMLLPVVDAVVGTTYSQFE